MKAKVIGVKRMEGTSKRTGKPYAGYIFHVAYPSRDKALMGMEVSQEFVTDGNYTKVPQPGDTVNIAYGKGGYVEDFTICE